MNKKLTILVLALATVAIISGFFFSSRSPSFSSIIVFGDSLSDTGNVWTLTNHEFPKDPYFEGRFTNGPVWVEVLASALHLPPPSPSLQGGLNFAYGGARTGHCIRKGKLDLSAQVQQYLDTHPSTPKSALVVLWAGGNDFISGAPLQLINNICNDIQKLASSGAKSFLIPNYPPLGYMPIFSHELPILLEQHILTAIDEHVHKYLKDSFGNTIGSMLSSFTPSVKNYVPTIIQDISNRVCNYMGNDPIPLENIPTIAFNTANALAQMYNHHLKLALEKLEKDLHIKIYQLDVYALFDTIAHNHLDYGFKFIDTTALDPKTHLLPPNTTPSEYIFFDGLHPTHQMHKIVANSALNLLFPNRKNNKP